MNPQDNHYIVAGGGLAGLSAAIELAGSGGCAVDLYEQSKILGGRAGTHAQQGFSMNIGPHGFYRAGMMKAQFDAWGIAYSGKPPLGKGASHLIAKGRTHLFPGTTAALFRCGAFSVGEKVKLGRILSSIGKLQAAPGETMQSWIDRQSSSPAVRAMLEAMTRLSTYSADPDLLDARAGLDQLVLAIKQSVLYIDGGWATLVTSLAAKARSLGVKIHTGCGVVAVEPGSVRLRTGERLEADGIVLAVPPGAVEQLTGVNLPEMIPARAACLDLGLRRLPARAATFALGLDEPTYVSVHSEYAAGLTPGSGGALVQLAMYLARNASCTREQLEQRADLILPGWRDELQFSRFLPEMTVVHAIPAAAHPRPDVDVLGMPSVAVAGDWVGPEAMLADAAVASGVRAARRLGSLTVRRERSAAVPR